MYAPTKALCCLTGIPIIDGQAAIAVAVRRYYDDPNRLTLETLEDVKYLARGVYDCAGESLRDVTQTSHPGMEPWAVPYRHGATLLCEVDPDLQTWREGMHHLFFQATAWDAVLEAELGQQILLPDTYGFYRERHTEREQMDAEMAGITVEALCERRYRGAEKIRWLDQPLHAEFCQILAFAMYARIPVFAYERLYVGNSFDLQALTLSNRLRATALIESVLALKQHQHD